jgi:hypothetical protein
MGMPEPPSYAQDGFRARTNVPDPSGINTAFDAGDAGWDVDWTQDTDELFRVRIIVKQTNAIADVTGDLATEFILQYNNGGAGWNNVGAVGGDTEDVQFIAASGFADGDNTTQLDPGGGSFVTGDGMENDTKSDTITFSTGSTSETELEFALEIVGANVTDADTIQLRLLWSDADEDPPATTLTETDLPLITANVVVSDVPKSDSDTGTLDDTDTQEIALTGVSDTATLAESVAIAVVPVPGDTATVTEDERNLLSGQWSENYSEDFTATVDAELEDVTGWEKVTGNADELITVTAATDRAVVTQTTTGGVTAWRYNGFSSGDFIFQVDVHTSLGASGNAVYVYFCMNDDPFASGEWFVAQFNNHFGTDPRVSFRTAIAGSEGAADLELIPTGGLLDDTTYRLTVRVSNPDGSTTRYEAWLDDLVGEVITGSFDETDAGRSTSGKLGLGLTGTGNDTTAWFDNIKTYDNATVHRDRLDTGSLASAESATVTVVASDTGTLADNGEAQIITEKDGTDTGTLADNAFTTSAGDDGETGTLDDVAAITAAATAGDTGASAEDPTIAAVIAANDSGSLVDDGSVSATTTKSGSDTATLVESASITATLVVGDTGTLAETATVGAVVVATDTGTLAEGTELDTGAVEKSGADTATLADDAAITATLTASDTATLAEDGVAVPSTASITDSDTGTLSESADVSKPSVTPPVPPQVGGGGGILVPQKIKPRRRRIRAEKVSVFASDAFTLREGATRRLQPVYAGRMSRILRDRAAGVLQDAREPDIFEQVPIALSLTGEALVPQPGPAVLEAEEDELIVLLIKSGLLN